jgi:hypothetical protein
MLAFPAGSARLAAKEEKMKGADFVVKALEALGTAEARAAAKSRVATGALQVTFRLGGQGQLRGKGVFASEGNKTRFDWGFPQVDYPGEQIAFNGSKVNVGQIRPGQWSQLGGFVYQYDFLLKEGLLGGELTTGWALLGVAERQPKLDYSGLKKVEGTQLHELRYRAKKGGGEVQVTLYFEPETFRHVRSNYRLSIPARMGTNAIDSTRQRDANHSIIERFGDFKQVDGLMLPQSYSLELTMEGGEQTFLATWSLAISEITHNQSIDPATFGVK